MSKIEPEEVDWFRQDVHKLLEFSLSQDPFKCRGNCKAPSGAYAGEPWLENKEIKEREGTRIELRCHVWTKFNREAAKGNVSQPNISNC